MGNTNRLKHGKRSRSYRMFRTEIREHLARVRHLLAEYR
jgi:hypothetical protein